MLRDKNDSDAYLSASCNGQLEIMKYLEKEHKWNIHVKDKYGNDAYLLASYFGHLEIMKYLEKEHNWDIKVKNNIGRDALYWAEQKKIIKILLNI